MLEAPDRCRWTLGYPSTVRHSEPLDWAMLARKRTRCKNRSRCSPTRYFPKNSTPNRTHKITARTASFLFPDTTGRPAFFPPNRSIKDLWIGARCLRAARVVHGPRLGYTEFVDALERAEEECRQCGIAAAMAAGGALGQSALQAGGG